MAVNIAYRNTINREFDGYKVTEGLLGGESTLLKENQAYIKHFKKTRLGGIAFFRAKRLYAISQIKRKSYTAIQRLKKENTGLLKKLRNR